MKNNYLILLFCATIFMTGCRNDRTDNELDGDLDTELEVDDMNTDPYMEADVDTADTAEEELVVQIESASGSNVSGEAVFTERNGEVTLTAQVSGLPQGQVAMHLHENADCSADDASSAGGHWNPTNEKHGKWGDPEGYHKGDIGNFDVNENGEGAVTITTDEWCIGCDDDNKNIIGTSVVIHDGVDDYTSQPSGDSGNRIGCGEVERNND